MTQTNDWTSEIVGRLIFSGSTDRFWSRNDVNTTEKVCTQIVLKCIHFFNAKAHTQIGDNFRVWTRAHTRLPHKFISTGGSDSLLRLPLVIFTQYVLWKDLLQLAHRVGARAAPLHAAQLRLQRQHAHVTRSETDTELTDDSVHSDECEWRWISKWKSPFIKMQSDTTVWQITASWSSKEMIYYWAVSLDCIRLYRRTS